MLSVKPVIKEAGSHNVVVDISAFKVSDSSEDILTTYSLGSCLGLTIYDPVAKVAGLVHCMLPLSKINPDKAVDKPGMFVDTGVPALLRAAIKLGAEKKRLELKALGCGQLLDKKGLFRIGERNHTVLRKLLWKNGLLLSGEHIGGSVSRTVKICVATGEVTVRVEGKELSV